MWASLAARTPMMARSGESTRTLTSNAKAYLKKAGVCNVRPPGDTGSVGFECASHAPNAAYCEQPKP